MSHLSLYRKYRPATFEQVIGQDHVTRTLKNAIATGKISHAYLFAGSRGTGKTSVAKLLAKALNCIDGPTPEPCGKCESCVAIAASTSLDVIEMDAASNRGIDDIRDIRDKVAFSPVEGNVKVYILDEAHMLTKEASNAFLKVLEEPPPHVIFVLCTTEAHKVIPTIQSRCQRFEFRRPDAGVVLNVLKRIVAAEDIDIEDTGLSAIARSSNGSFRDAIGALDQLATYCDKQIALTDVLSMLGTFEPDLLFEIVDIVAESDTRGALLFVNRLAESGRDFSRFVDELISHLRNIFLLQQVQDNPPGMIDAPDEDLSRLKGQSRLLSPGLVLRLIDLLSDAHTRVKQGGDPRLQLELALVAITRPEVDMSTKSLLYRIKQLEERGPAGRQKNSAEGRESYKTEPAAEKEMETPAEVAPERESTDKPPGIELSLDRITRAWSIILTQVKKKKIPLYSLLQESAPLKLEDSTLTVAFPPGSEFYKNQVEKPHYLAILSEVLQEMTGTELKVSCVIADEAAPQQRRDKEAPDPEEVVAMIKKEFKAEEVE